MSLCRIKVDTSVISSFDRNIYETFLSSTKGKKLHKATFLTSLFVYLRVEALSRHIAFAIFLLVITEAQRMLSVKHVLCVFS